MRVGLGYLSTITLQRIASMRIATVFILLEFLVLFPIDSVLSFSFLCHLLSVICIYGRLCFVVYLSWPV